MFKKAVIHGEADMVHAPGSDPFYIRFGKEGRQVVPVQAGLGEPVGDIGPKTQRRLSHLSFFSSFFLRVLPARAVSLNKRCRMYSVY
jgi:hypothetical protein